MDGWSVKWSKAYFVAVLLLQGDKERVPGETANL